MSQAVVHQVNISAGGVPKNAVPAGTVSAHGIEGDRQAKQGIHGGPYRALCLFPLEAIERLAAEGHPIEPGSIGENITTRGLDWEAVLPGARLRIGSDVLVEVTGYADPCSTIRGAFAGGDIHLVNHRRNVPSRVYAQVLTEGEVRPGDPIVLVAHASGDQALPAEAGVRRVAQVSIAVSDIERSIAFYRDGLGASMGHRVDEAGLAFLHAGEMTLMLEGPAHGAEVAPGSATIYFEVEDIEGSFDAMRSRGVPFDVPPMLQYQAGNLQGWMAFLRDPDGNRLALVSHVTV